jgi:hypothetical protein
MFSQSFSKAISAKSKLNKIKTSLKRVFEKLGLGAKVQKCFPNKNITSSLN